ncbi:MAG TPA: protein-L-isoaspartate(D-aspartate) O-methyltransferase [Thermoplasmata archaeon]|nr:protein-L-isoaspartate(D-aspartate) O-methyltransferase [Thermoplasmata archaeon]
MTDFSERRSELVDGLIRRGYATKREVAEALMKVPREEFVPRSLMDEAYIDTPLPIGSGQTISAPHMVAMMVEALDLRPGQKVLEVGGGSGYHAAVTAELVSPGGHVFTVERLPELVEFARDNITRTGYSDSVTVILSDGSVGLPSEAPFDRIFVACGAPAVPEPLKSQLKDGGLMLVPVGGRMYQDLVRIERRGDRYIREDLGGCVFVPLVGEHGY